MPGVWVPRVPGNLQAPAWRAAGLCDVLSRVRARVGPLYERLDVSREHTLCTHAWFGDCFQIYFQLVISIYIPYWTLVWLLWAFQYPA